MMEASNGLQEPLSFFDAADKTDLEQFELWTSDNKGRELGSVPFVDYRVRVTTRSEELLRMVRLSSGAARKTDHTSRKTLSRA